MPNIGVFASVLENIEKKIWKILTPTRILIRTIQKFIINIDIDIEMAILKKIDIDSKGNFEKYQYR